MRLSRGGCEHGAPLERGVFRGGFCEKWWITRTLGVRRVESVSRLEAGGVNSRCDASPQARTSVKHCRFVEINCPALESWEVDERGRGIIIIRINSQGKKKTNAGDVESNPNPYINVSLTLLFISSDRELVF